MTEPFDVRTPPPDMLAMLDDPRLADMKDAPPNFPRTRRLLDPVDPPKRGESRYLQYHGEAGSGFGSLEWVNKPPVMSYLSRTGSGLGFPLLTERPIFNERRRRPKSRVDVWDYLGWLVASPAFVAVLRRFDPDAIETREIDWTFSDGQRLDGYVFLDIRRRVDAFDYTRSKLVVEMEKGRKFVAWLAHPRALKRDIEPSFHVFRDDYWRHHLFMSRPLAQALVEEGLRGFRFEDPVDVMTVRFEKPKRAVRPVVRAPVPGSCAADKHWLVDLGEQLGGSARVQGDLVDSIAIYEEAFDDPDPYVLVQANIDFVNYLLLQARLVPGEFPQQGLWAYYVDYYRAQVADGGHAQFLENSNFTPLTVGCCLRGLRAIGATDHLAAFEELVAFVSRSDERTLHAEIAREVHGGRSKLAELDERHADSSDLVARCAAWLRGLECVRAVSTEELLRARDEATRANTMRERRAADSEQGRRDASSAAERVVRALCKSAGVKFVCLAPSDRLSMRKLAAAAPNRREFCWGVLTGAGPHQVFFYEAREFLRTRLRAEMWHKDGPRAAAAMTLTSEEYERIVPDYLSRRRMRRG